jgi:DNA-binding transcriptional ArsR family regulator
MPASRAKLEKRTSLTLASAPVAGARMSELQKNARRVAALLKSMANPARLVILCQLAENERSVGELERAVGLSQSGISQHLAVLRRGDVVASRRDGQTVFYSLASAEVATLMATLYAVFCHEAPARAAPSRAKTRAA